MFQHDRKGARKLEHAIKATNLDFSASARIRDGLRRSPRDPRRRGGSGACVWSIGRGSAHHRWNEGNY